MRILSVLFCAAVLCLFAACTKPTTTPVSDVPSATFTNKTGKDIIVRYWEAGRKPDYLYIKPGEQGLIAGVNKKVNYYWATSDFTMSNWYLRETIDNPTIVVLQGDHQNIDIKPVHKSIDMLCALDGIDGPTDWVAVDARQHETGNSIWHTLSKEDKDQRIIIKPDYEVLHMSPNKEKRYKVWAFDSNEWSLNISAEDSAGDKAIHIGNWKPGTSDAHFKKDTVSLTLYTQYDFHYILVRKK